jgi:hypothetical protein
MLLTCPGIQRKVRSNIQMEVRSSWGREKDFTYQGWGLASRSSYQQLMDHIDHSP